jgi:hypothetical protein
MPQESTRHQPMTLDCTEGASQQKKKKKLGVNWKAWKKRTVRNHWFHSALSGEHLKTMRCTK